MSIKGLIGGTGFVGGALLRQRSFERVYNSKTIQDIAGERFDLVVCAGAPATMWAANANPEADAANLARLVDCMRSARIERLVLISTVAVFDDMAAGYTESSARYEQAKAYGRNRRWLEQAASDSFECCVLRLPALFGPGLKKNFIFDLMNPIPSFVAPARFETVQADVAADERLVLERAFSWDEGLRMWKFAREEFRDDPEGAGLEAAFRRIGFISRSFTNSASRYQFYNIERLGQDIDLALERRLAGLNICSTPLSADEIHRELFGEGFDNPAPAVVNEDVRSDHAGLFGSPGPYLFGREQVLAELKRFVASGGSS